MTEQTSTGFRTEGQPAFPVLDTANDTAAASSAGKTDTQQTQSQGGEQGQADNKAAAGENKGATDTDDFAKHPRWAERETDWKNRFNEQETRHTSELAKLRTEFEQKFAGLAPKANETNQTPAEVPPWFGGDEKQWAEFQKWNEGLLSKVKTEARGEALKELTSKQENEQKAIKEATDYFNAEVTAIEADKTLNPKGEKVDRNKLLKTAQDFDLVTSDGKWNYKAAYRMMSQQFTPAPNKDRKDLAAATVSGGKAETKQGTVTTSDDFAGPGKRPW